MASGIVFWEYEGSNYRMLFSGSDDAHFASGEYDDSCCCDDDPIGYNSHSTLGLQILDHNDVCIKDYYCLPPTTGICAESVGQCAISYAQETGNIFWWECSNLISPCFGNGSAKASYETLGRSLEDGDYFYSGIMTAQINDHVWQDTLRYSIWENVTTVIPLKQLGDSCDVSGSNMEIHFPELSSKCVGNVKCHDEPLFKTVDYFYGYFRPCQDAASTEPQIDISGSSLTNNNCDACDTIDGTYVLNKPCYLTECCFDRQSEILTVDGVDICDSNVWERQYTFWGYDEDDVPLCTDPSRMFYIHLDAYTTGHNIYKKTKLQCKVAIGSRNCTDSKTYYAEYQSESFSICDFCFPSTGRILERTAQYKNDDICSGDFPTTITVEPSS